MVGIFFFLIEFKVFFKNKFQICSKNIGWIRIRNIVMKCADQYNSNDKIPVPNKDDGQKIIQKFIGKICKLYLGGVEPGHTVHFTGNCNIEYTVSRPGTGFSFFLNSGVASLCIWSLVWYSSPCPCYSAPPSW